MAAELRARISADATPYLGALGAVRRATLGMSGAVSSIGGALGIGFSVAGIAAAIKGVANFGDEISDASKRTGIGVMELQKLRFMAKLSGVDFGGLQNAIKFMGKNLDEAQTKGGAAAETFSRLGINTKDLAKLSVDDQFLAIVGALEKETNQTKRAALAMKVFGRSGVDILSLVADGVGGLQQAKDRFIAGGGILSEADVKAASDFNDELDLMAATVQGQFQQSIMSTFPQMIDLLSRNQEAVANLGFAFDGMAIAIQGFVGLFSTLGSIGTGVLEKINTLAEGIATRMAALGLAKEGSAAAAMASARGMTAGTVAAEFGGRILDSTGPMMLYNILNQIYQKLPEKR